MFAAVGVLGLVLGASPAGAASGPVLQQLAFPCGTGTLWSVAASGDSLLARCQNASWALSVDGGASWKQVIQDNPAVLLGIENVTSPAGVGPDGAFYAVGSKSVGGSTSYHLVRIDPLTAATRTSEPFTHRAPNTITVVSGNSPVMGSDGLLWIGYCDGVAPNFRLHMTRMTIEGTIVSDHTAPTPSSTCWAGRLIKDVGGEMFLGDFGMTDVGYHVVDGNLVTGRNPTIVDEGQLKLSSNAASIDGVWLDNLNGNGPGRISRVPGNDNLLDIEDGLRGIYYRSAPGRFLYAGLPSWSASTSRTVVDTKNGLVMPQDHALWRYQGPYPAIGHDAVTGEAGDIIDLINHHRQDAGLTPFVADAQIVGALQVGDCWQAGCFGQGSWPGTQDASVSETVGKLMAQMPALSLPANALIGAARVNGNTTYGIGFYGNSEGWLGAPAGYPRKVYRGSIVSYDPDKKCTGVYIMVHKPIGLNQEPAAITVAGPDGVVDGCLQRQSSLGVGFAVNGDLRPNTTYHVEVTWPNSGPPPTTWDFTTQGQDTPNADSGSGRNRKKQPRQIRLTPIANKSKLKINIDPDGPGTYRVKVVRKAKTKWAKYKSVRTHGKTHLATVKATKGLYKARLTYAGKTLTSKSARLRR